MTIQKCTIVLSCALFFGWGCMEKGTNSGSQTRYLSARVPVAQIDANGDWGELQTSRADLALVFPENYFPGLEGNLEMDTTSIQISKDARNHTETTQEYLTGLGYDKQDYRKVYMKIQLFKEDGMLFLKATEVNLTQIFQCDSSNPDCKLKFEDKQDLMPYCFDSIVQSNCLLRQDVLGI